MRVINSLKTRLIRLPIYAAGVIKAGNLVIPGVTAETDLGVLKVAPVGANVGAFGVLQEDQTLALTAKVDGSAGWFAPIGSAEKDFPSRLVELIDGHTLVRMDYDLTGVTGATSATDTLTLAALEDNIDTAFFYMVSGAAAGEMRFAKASASGSATMSNNFTTQAVAGYVVKILPLFHTLFTWKSAPTTSPMKIDTVAAAGAGRAIQVERLISRNGLEEQLDPYTHGNLSKLDRLNQFAIRGTLQITNSAFHPLS